MSVYKVKVKWGKELFKDIELDINEPTVLFKAQLYALTGVHPDRQKLFCKGATIKDDNWNNLKISDGAMFLMMGSKDELPNEPQDKPVFVEDMTEKQLAISLDVPGGLQNMGNTCYLNATLQCLKTVPELRDALKKLSENDANRTGNQPKHIALAMNALFNLMDKDSSVTPFLFLRLFHTTFPRFAETERGSFVQQDANECWVELIRALQQKLPPLEDSSASESDPAKAKSFIDQFFGGKYDVELKCTESDDEPVTRFNEDFLQLSCFISQEVKYMTNGLKNKICEQITKHSSVLGRDAVFNKIAKISRLPAYLTIQFVRFFYKEKEKINAKILKDIQFPLEFDAYDLCSEELQKKLEPVRNKFKELEEAEVAKSLSQDKVTNKGEPSEKKYKTEPFSFPNDIGSNNSGYYELQAVLTHKGRSSSSGHYVGWVRYKTDKWVKCDDDEVTPVTSEEILKLSGGGDWHCAYVILYGPKVLKIPVEE